jgi:hypothetical protein
MKFREVNRAERRMELFELKIKKLAGPPGFEPGQKDPKSFVLPLHNGPPAIVIIALQECDWQSCGYVSRER